MLLCPEFGNLKFALDSCLKTSVLLTQILSLYFTFIPKPKLSEKANPAAKRSVSCEVHIGPIEPYPNTAILGLKNQLRVTPKCAAY